MEYYIPYGDTMQKFEAGEDAIVLNSQISEITGGAGQGEIVRSAMEHPVGTRRLCELAQGKKKAVLIISDHTRPVPSQYIVPFMLEEMRRGNPDIDITLLVATGCHRGTSKEELIQKLGANLCSQEKIAVHDCDASPVTDLGILPSGAHLLVNSLVAEADLVTAEGFIEPHFFAGFSGGRKSILPGVCSRRTVLGNHCAEFIRSPNARAGVMEGNPVNQDMEAAAVMANLEYIVNVVIDGKKRVAAAFAGAPLKAHHAGIRYLSRYCCIKLHKKGDIVVTSNGGAPLDQNIYQAVKGMSTAECAASDHAIIIMCAYCRDGIGGEDFYRALKECESAKALLREIHRIPMDETQPDQWQYQILARILEKHHVIFVTRPELESAVENMKMEYAPSLQEAYGRARQEKGEDAELVIIPDGVSLIIQ